MVTAHQGWVGRVFTMLCYRLQGRDDDGRAATRMSSWFLPRAPPPSGSANQRWNKPASRVQALFPPFSITERYQPSLHTSPKSRNYRSSFGRQSIPARQEEQCGDPNSSGWRTVSDVTFLHRSAREQTTNTKRDSESSLFSRLNGPRL